MRRHALLPLLVLLVTDPASAENPAETLARGKLETDLGHYDDAAATFASVVGAAGASTSQRFEARVRLGVVRRAQGKTSASVDAFEAAWRERPQDAEAIGLLVRAVGDALPGKQRWSEIWPEVSLRVDRQDGRPPEARMVWPGIRTSLCPCSGAPIDLDIENVDVPEILRLFADVSGLNIVLQPAHYGTVSFTAHQAPWDQALRRILAPNGFAALRNGNLITIGRAGELPEKRAFAGKPIDVDYVDVDLVRALSEIAAHGRARVEVPEGVAGRVSLALKGVPWDQAFDVLAWVNGLDWTRDGDVLRVTVRRHGVRQPSDG